MKINIQWEFTKKKTFEGNVQIQNASLNEVKDCMVSVIPEIVASIYESVLEKIKEAPMPKTWKVATVSLLLTETVKHTLEEMDDKLDTFIWSLADDDE